MCRPTSRRVSPNHAVSPSGGLEIFDEFWRAWVVQAHEVIPGRRGAQL